MKRILKPNLFLAALLALSTTVVCAQGTVNNTAAFAPKGMRVNNLSNQAPIVAVNGIAVVVNNEVITRQELQERIQMIEQRLKFQGIASPPRAELTKQVIERLIVDRAQLQLARDTGLRIDDVMLDRAILRMAQQNKLTMSALRAQVEKDGMSYAQFRESVRDDIMLQNVVEREVNSKVQVSESEVDNYLLAQKGQEGDLSQQQAAGIPQAHVRHILIKLSPTVTKEQARNKLLELKQRVEHGDQFEELAKHFSTDASAAKGGDLGWLQPGDVPEFEPTINALKDGQVSEPIETPFGMHLIQLVGHKTDEVSPERQRLLVRQTIRARKLEEATSDWTRELRDRAYVEVRSDDNHS